MRPLTRAAYPPRDWRSTNFITRSAEGEKSQSSISRQDSISSHSRGRRSDPLTCRSSINSVCWAADRKVTLIGRLGLFGAVGGAGEWRRGLVVSVSIDQIFEESFAILHVGAPTHHFGDLAIPLHAVEALDVDDASAVAADAG